MQRAAKGGVEHFHGIPQWAYGVERHAQLLDAGQVAEVLRQRSCEAQACQVPALAQRGEQELCGMEVTRVACLTCHTTLRSFWNALLYGTA